MSEARPLRVAVLGGGISGLAAAERLACARQAGAPVEETLLEASPRLGGLIRTERVDDFLIEAGPDSFLTEKPEAADLCRELGLGESLVGSNDAIRRTYVLHRGRLRPLPDGLLMLVPTRWWPLTTTPLIPLGSKLAVLRDWFARPDASGSGPDDESVESFVRRHLGQGMVENLAEPLLAGVFGGEAKQLSARAALPRFWEMERRHGSLVRPALAARRARAKRPATPAAPLFTTLQDGLEAMVKALEGRLDPWRVRRQQRALEMETNSDGAGLSSREVTYQIRLAGGDACAADAVILALPAHEGARLLRPLDPALAGHLAAIPYTAALTVALGYDAQVRRALPSGFGFVVPRQAGHRLLAGTFVHNKFDHRAPPDRALVRGFLGGARDPEVLKLDDAEIVALTRRELSTILHLAATPLFSRVYRWPASMPQYVVGHEARRRAIEERLQSQRGVFLASNAYSGIGISDAIRSGRAAAEQALNLATGTVSEPRRVPVESGP